MPPKELKKVYLVILQSEGTIQTPMPYFLLSTAMERADKIAGNSDRAEDDVRVFELDLAELRCREHYVPPMKSTDEAQSEEE
jgi:hypothetical protein